jgi:hypothetical protein
VSRFSEAISEGDGISVIPVLEGDVEALAALAEEAGAEAIAVGPVDVALARARTGLPILARDGDPEAVASAGADALVVHYESTPDEVIESLYDVASELGLCTCRTRHVSRPRNPRPSHIRGPRPG